MNPPRLCKQLPHHSSHLVLQLAVQQVQGLLQPLVVALRVEHIHAQPRQLILNLCMLHNRGIRHAEASAGNTRCHSSSTHSAYWW